VQASTGSVPPPTSTAQARSPRDASTSGIAKRTVSASGLREQVFAAFDEDPSVLDQ
jgi:hypothetical protein